MRMSEVLERAVTLLTQARYNRDILCPMAGQRGMSMRGAVIEAAGSGPAAWPIFAVMQQEGLISPRIAEPRTKELALGVLRQAIVACKEIEARPVVHPHRAKPVPQIGRMDQ